MSSAVYCLRTISRSQLAEDASDGAGGPHARALSGGGRRLHHWLALDAARVNVVAIWESIVRDHRHHVNNTLVLEVPFDVPRTR